MMFSNLFWIVHQLGFAGDTLCCFLNMHSGRMKQYHLVKGRARSTVPGILLNWAWYYPRWYRVQKHDVNLYKSLYLHPGRIQFSQAHFFNHEDQLLDLFAGSKTLTLTAQHQSNAVIYNRFAHYKLLDKKLYQSWYLKQQMNFPLHRKENQILADRLFQSGLTVGQYRAIAFMDWHGMTLSDMDCDPVTFWHAQPYLNFFQENLNTALINNSGWMPYYDDRRQHRIFIDRLADPSSQTLDDDYYAEVCDRLNLAPDHDFYHAFWKKWFADQPDIDYEPDLSWRW